MCFTESMMCGGPDRTRELLSGLVGASPEARGYAADSVTDRLRSFDSQEAAIIARVLLWLASVETDDSAKEAQLHALAELAERDLVPKDVLTELGLLSPDELRGSPKEYFDYLLSLRDLRWHGRGQADLPSVDRNSRSASLRSTDSYCQSNWSGRSLTDAGPSWARRRPWPTYSARSP
jgi:hypothetical protein